MNWLAFTKYILTQWFNIPMDCYCRRCGRSFNDFLAPNWAWRKIEPLIPIGSVICYDCFCNLCELVGIFPFWILKESYTCGHKNDILFSKCRKCGEGKPINQDWKEIQ